jgi:hypothetical protein
VALVRNNTLDQVISRAVAAATNIWHRNAAPLKSGDPYEGMALPTGALNMAILMELPGVIRQTVVVRQVAKAYPEQCLLIEYEHLADSVEASSRRLTEHARKAGFAPSGQVAVRSLRKLIDEDRSADFKADFKAFMERHTGLW